MRALVYDTAFRERAARKQAWGFGLLSVAVATWFWVAWQLLVPYSAEYGGNQNTCASRVFYDAETKSGKWLPYADVEGEACAAKRDFAGLLASVLASFPLAVIGTILYTSGSAAVRQSEHAAEVTRLTEFPQG